MERHDPLNIAKAEVDEKITTKLLPHLGNDTAALALLMTYVPAKVTPSRSVHGQIGLVEELGIEDAITEIKKQGINKLFLLINSFGGDVSSSYKVARALRDNFEEITVFIPHIAASGGTLIALIGNRMVMGDVSSITPIDVQKYRNGQMFSVNSMIRAFNALNELFSDTEEKDAPYPWKAMANKLDPVEFQEWVDTSKLMEKHALEILEHERSSLKDKAGTIVGKLISGYPVHQYTITYNEAQSIFGDDVCHKNCDAQYAEIWTVMKMWLRKYLSEEASNHIIRFILPKVEPTGGV